MLFRRSRLAALAAVTGALAVAIPATSASAATPATGPIVDPTVCQLLSITEGPFGPTMFIGGASLAHVLATAGNSVGCPAPTPAPTPTRPTFPFFPWVH
jgi:hypothetical protein